MTKGNLAVLITVFVLLIIGIVLLGTVADESSTLDDTAYVANESVTAINSTFVELANDWITEFNDVRLFNGTPISSTLYENDNKDGEINISEAAVLEQAELTGGSCYTFYVNYTAANSAIGMSENSSSRTIVDLVPLFFAIALVLGSMYVVWMNREVLGF